jgi:integrase
MLFWSESEASDFLKSAANRYPPGSQSRWIYVSYLIALNTALRAGEIWGLKPIDLSDNGRLLQVRRQFNRVTLEFSQPKGKRARVVPCNESLAHEIRELLKTNRIGPDQTIFQNEKGNPVCHDNFANRQFAKDLRSWSGRSIRFHDLRHTATTLMIANGIDLKTVKEICGHANIQTTMNYVHLVSGSIERVAESFAIRPTQERREDEKNATLSLIKRAGNS